MFTNFIVMYNVKSSRTKPLYLFTSGIIHKTLFLSFTLYVDTLSR